MRELLNDFLSVEKLECGKEVNDPVRFNLKCNIEELLDEVTPLLNETFQIHYTHSGKEEDVMLDKKLLRNIMNNLISNAIKFSKDATNIKIQSSISGNDVKISVQDFGMGISEEDQKHLFERFWRAKNVTNIQGTGLGLNIVKKYVDLMDGEITINSKVNFGTTFNLKFTSDLKN